MSLPSELAQQPPRPVALPYRSRPRLNSASPPPCFLHPSRAFPQTLNSQTVAYRADLRSATSQRKQDERKPRSGLRPQPPSCRHRTLPSPYTTHPGSNECIHLERAKPHHCRILDRYRREQLLVWIVRQRGRRIGSAHCPQLLRQRDSEELFSDHRVQRSAARGSGRPAERAAWKELVRVSGEREHFHQARHPQHARHRRRRRQRQR